jgi:hypothetical protein
LEEILEQQMKARLDPQMNVMTMDDALINWGNPTNKTEGDKIVIWEWNNSIQKQILIITAILSAVLM